ncbi:MAG: preprotein translocase subunit SecA [Acidimicrobiia bacterium]|nr:preprotein translocase subunit SecA [Acidimicrobiia bacterium]
MKLLDRILRAGDGKRLRAAQSIVEPVNSLESEIRALSDDQLRAKTADFKQRLDNGALLDDLMVEAFAVIRETAIRVIGQRHYDVQLIGGAALHWGSVAEMKTGEGKTLVSTLPVYLNALTGDGVHVVTVNEYLATRDAEWMGQIHRWHGLTVGLVVPGDRDSAFKREQYASDITYGTNNEFGFDYLRDNMARSLEGRTQRGHNYAIVDEIDSILIDEARTPLIISGKVRGAAEIYYRFAEIVNGLQRDEHYEVDEEKRQVAVTEEGINRVEEALGIENLYAGVQGDLVHQLNAALRAKELFHRDKDYLVTDGEVKIVDEFTGRVLEGRRWSDGLHQAVEAKENVKIKDEQQTLATVTLQNYFRLYDKLAGMTGTAQADAAELETTYGLSVVQIPTNEPVIRADKADLIYKTEDAKFAAAIDDIEERVAAGQPVLVGTASVEKSEKLSQLMINRGIAHEVLNAKQHFREADIVAQAGKSGAVTVATNMAGRGVDIILGGNAEKLAEADTKAEGFDLDSEDGQAYLEKRLAHWEPICAQEGASVRKAGGLYVLATERHESRRIDDQLRGRSGRQGDPGESRFYLSLEDDLMRIFATGAMNWVMDRALPEDVPIESNMVTKSVERAQNTVEQRNGEIRKNVLKYDEVYNQQRKVVYARRQQILEQGDLREDSLNAFDDVAEYLVGTYCEGELDDTWDVDGLLTELRTFWPTELEADELANSRSLRQLEETISSEGKARYEQRESELGESVMRQIERQIMLQLIDQRWRDHLTEMANLREGINLRAMGQRDPLVEWQAEGFDLFSEMMHSLNVDYLRYLMHVEVVPQQTQPTTVAASAEKATPSAVGDAATNGSASGRPAPGRVAALQSGLGATTTTDVVESSSESEPPEAEPARSSTTPYIKDEWDKTPRNAPCPCGSGKKFKQCHGRR